MVEIEEEKSKKFLSAMDTTLGTFQSINEWPDFISFLSKLSKTISHYSSQKYLSRKMQVAKRLSQCLNPAHPTGVHQKALEVYDQIFTMVDPTYLEGNIEVLTFGLFTFFKHSSMSVKPLLLTIFDKHFISQENPAILQTLMESLLASLLSGIDEPNEFLERCIELLWKIEAKESQHFMNSFWAVLAKYSHCRLGGLNFVLKEKERFFRVMLAVKDSLNYDVVTLAINNCLTGERDSLIIRHALDVACYLFPISNEDSKQQEWLEFSWEQKKVFVRSILTCLLKRNFSLTRRVYNWLVGVVSEESSVTSNTLSSTENGISTDAVNSSALPQSVKRLLTECFVDMLNVSSSVELQTALLPYKIMGYFLDRSEVSVEILRSIFMNFLLKAYDYYPLFGEDYLAGVNRLFSLVDLELAWNEIFSHLLDKGISGNSQFIEFILEKTAMLDQEAKVLFVPNLLLLLIHQNADDFKLFQKIVSLSEFTKEYDHSLVQKAEFKIITNQQSLFSTCIFAIVKYSLTNRQLFALVKILFKDLIVVNLNGLEEDLCLNDSIDAKRIKLLLLEYHLLHVDKPMEFIEYILDGAEEEQEILESLQSIFPDECEKFFIIQYRQNLYPIEQLISYWNAFPNHPMLLLTCLLLEHLNATITQQTSDESSVNRWIMEDKLSFEKLYNSLLILLPTMNTFDSLQGKLYENERQILFALEKIHQIFKFRKEHFFQFLKNHSSERTIVHEAVITESENHVPSSTNATTPFLHDFLQMILNIFQIPFEKMYIDIYSEIVFLLADIFDQLKVSGPQELIEVIIVKMLDKLNHLLEPVLFKNIMHLVFMFVQANLGKLNVMSLIEPCIQNIYHRSSCLSEYCNFMLAMYLRDPTETMLASLEGILKDLISLRDPNGRLLNLYQITVLVLFMLNGCSLVNLPILNGALEKSGLPSTLFIDCDFFNSYLANLEPYINSVFRVLSLPAKRSLLNGQLFLQIMEYAFLTQDDRLDYLLISCYLLDSEVFMECFLRFWSGFIFKNESNIQTGRKVVDKINSYSNLQLMNHHRNLALTLSLCLFGKKSSTFTVMISEAIGLDYLLQTFSSSNWKPTETCTYSIINSFRDFFDSNRGRFTFIGCKFFVFITNYILLSGFGDKKILRESQDSLVKLLLLATNKMSKLISTSLKKTFSKSANSTEALEESNEYSEIEQILNFFGHNLFYSSNLLGKENEKVPEFLGRFATEILLPLIGFQLSVGWRTLESFIKVDSWIKFWKKDISVDYFSGNREFFKAEFVQVKSKLLATAWTHNGSAIESERLCDWISNRLVLPLPSNVNMLFMNKESEFSARCDNIHQISAIIFSCPKNHFLRAFPLLNEKIVESFRVLDKCNVHAEILLLIKVILLRFDLSVISNFFPILFNELYGILQLVPDVANFCRADSPEIFQLVYRACQVLDLLYTINSYEFQSYSGVFFAPNGKSGFLDHWRRIYESNGNIPDFKRKNTIDVEHICTEKRRPFLIDSLDKVNCLFDFLPKLLNHGWQQQRENLYQGEIDHKFVDQLLGDEIYCL